MNFVNDIKMTNDGLKRTTSAIKMYKLRNRTNYVLSHICIYLVNQHNTHMTPRIYLLEKSIAPGPVARRTTLARGGEPRIILTDNSSTYWVPLASYFYNNSLRFVVFVRISWLPSWVSDTFSRIIVSNMSGIGKEHLYQYQCE